MKRIVFIAIAAVVCGLAVFWFLYRPSAIEEEIGRQTWTLVKMTVDQKEVPVPGDGPATFEPMGEGRYVGMAGVNHYESHLRINRQGKIKFDHYQDGGVTEMGGPPHLMAFESAYIAAFWKAQSANVSGATLVLRGKDVELTYEGKPVAPIDRSGSPEDTVSSGGLE